MVFWPLIVGLLQHTVDKSAYDLLANLHVEVVNVIGDNQNERESSRDHVIVFLMPLDELEYFCNEGDEFWSMPDEDIIAQGIDEVDSINIVDRNEVIDSMVIKMPKAYPAYFGTYHQLPEIKDHLDRIENLFLVGRNGMHKYNNQDHSMLSAMTAVENIVNEVKSKGNIWQINTEEEYHESK